MPQERVTAKQRQRVAERAQYCCEYCLSQVRFATQSFSVEHITPRHHGGTSTLDNLAFACQGCNNHKHIKTEGFDGVSGQQVPLYHPRRDIWGVHFRWNEDCALIVGITPIGRATVVALRLNRDNVVNLRHVLYATGEHPPAYRQTENGSKTVRASKI